MMSKPSPEYDVVIVGAGPAGGTLANLVSQRKAYRVAVFEARPWESLWGKPCGDAIGEHHFAERGIPKPRGEAVLQRIEGMEIYSPKEDIVYKVYGEGYTIDRTKFGQQLLKEAMDNGVEVFTKTHVSRPIVEDGYVKGVVVNTGDGQPVEVRAKITIDSTGSSGPLKRYYPSDWPIAERLNPKDTDIAYREIAYLDYDIERPEYIRIYLNQRIAPGGYWWFFPEGRNRANIGLGVQGGMGYPHPREIYHKELMKRPEINRYVKLVSAMGAVVPTRRPMDSLAWNGVMVIGDAAFTVNPVHGGGMGYAMEAAYWAAKAIDEAFDKGDYSVETLWTINRGFMPTIGAKQAALEVTRAFLQRLSDDDIQFIMEKRLVSEEDVDLLGRNAELDQSVVERITGALGDLMKIVRAAGRPSLLMRLKDMADTMKKAKALYQRYPNSPEDLPPWSREVRELIEGFKKRIGAL